MVFCAWNFRCKEDFDVAEISQHGTSRYFVKGNVRSSSLTISRYDRKLKIDGRIPLTLEELQFPTHWSYNQGTGTSCLDDNFPRHLNCSGRPLTSHHVKNDLTTVSFWFVHHTVILFVHCMRRRHGFCNVRRMFSETYEENGRIVLLEGTYVPTLCRLS